VVGALRDAGAEVRVLSRHSESHPVDLTTGAGLDVALLGCGVVVDASNGSTRHPQPVIVDGTRRLVAAAARAGVGHLVTISIVGIDDVPMGYYRAKLTQEQLVKAGEVPWSIVRSTQFHELVGFGLAALGRWRVSPRSGAVLQPVAAREAAGAVMSVALEAPGNRTVTVAGPRIQTVTALARDWSAARGGRMVAVPLPLAGRVGRALRAGALTCADPDRRGETGFRAWLG
jgi:uncharacterized protein YbjT (DUF2867 family)